MPRKPSYREPRQPAAPVEAQVLVQPKHTYRVGRPTFCTAEATELVAKLVSAGLSIVVACQALGIKKHLWEDWNKLGKRDVAAGVDSIFARWWDAMCEAKAASEANLVRMVQAGAPEDWKAAAWLLERRHAKRWGKREVEPPKDDGAEFAAMSTEEIRAELAERAKSPPLLVQAVSTSDSEGTVPECE